MRYWWGRRLAFSRIAVPLALAFAVVIAPTARSDDRYLSDADAPAAVFPDADHFERREVPSTPDLRARLAARLGDVKPTVWESTYKIATAFHGGVDIGRAIEVEEVGKHRAITLIVGVDPRERVTGVAVMVYREAYGGEIARHRFLEQYRGKNASDPLLPSQDIRNITGATLSARAVGRAVKKAIAVAAELGKERDAAPTPTAARSLPQASTTDMPVTVREAHYVMGTILEITVVAPAVDVGRSWIRQAVGEARRLDRELTSFSDESALARLNRQAGQGFVRVPADLYRIVALSKDLSRATDGTFDVTVSPAVRLWESAAVENRWPSRGELAQARRAIGAERIRLRPPSEIALPAGAAVELGGIGKGYAADRLAALLRELGARAALINFGESSLAAVGPPPSAPPWPIWVRRGRLLDGPILLRDAALSTSASFGRSLRIGDRRLGHIVDPRSGKPLEQTAQATVIATSAGEAEAWSKALLVDERRAFAELSHRPSLGGLLLRPNGAREDDRFARQSGWNAMR